jgi:hypothetical protein
MRMHKFLAAGAVGPISGFAWPADAWVDVEGPLAACSRGIHVCRPGDLAHWIHDELWELEVDEGEGAVVEGLDCLIVQRARLARPIEGWRVDGARRFAAASVAHVASLTGLTGGRPEVRELLDDARFMASEGYVALAAYTSALAYSRTVEGREPEDLYRQERAWQSAWIGHELL